MNAEDIIRSKRDGRELSQEEIEYFIKGLVDKKVADYQAAAWAMAVYFRGMTRRETSDLALAMAYSGEVLDLTAIAGIKVDKHSTGGVGDKTTPVVVPLCAAAGVPVAKLSGRGLGFTGGTIDKFESIPGFQTELSRQEFISQVNRIKAAVISQTGNLVPADKILYAIRDVTATVDSIPLIASSVMSKKIASGADGIVLDIKVGQGAFMKDRDQATELAETMVAIGRQARRRVSAILSDMNRPLGSAIGNALEIQEAVDTLRGQGPGDLTELCLLLASHMVYLGGKAPSIEEAHGIVKEILAGGRGYDKLCEMVAAQGGQAENLNRIAELAPASLQVEIRSDRAGYIKSLRTDEIGRIVMRLGAGRERTGEPIDHAVGVKLYRKPGDLVEVNDTLAAIYANAPQKMEAARKAWPHVYTWGDNPPQPTPIILGTVSD